jgi:hypothetical protein
MAENTKYTYDSAGSQYSIESVNEYVQARWMDGNGNLVREHIGDWVWNPMQTDGTYVPRVPIKYYIRSSVMGGAVISEALRDGRKETTFVYGFGKVIGRQSSTFTPFSIPQMTSWDYTDPSEASVRKTNQLQTWASPPFASELDPLNIEVGMYQTAPIEDTEPWNYPRNGDRYEGVEGCTVDGASMDCGLVSGESTVQCPSNYCGPTANSDGTSLLPAFHAFANGTTNRDRERPERTSGPPRQKPELKHKKAKDTSSYLQDDAKERALNAGTTGEEQENERNEGGDDDEETTEPERLITIIPKGAFAGGVTNQIAQLAPCKRLKITKFDDLEKVNPAALKLLKSSYGEKAGAEYAKFSIYDKAVFLNTAAAAQSVGVNFSKATFTGFYNADGTNNGIYVTGISGKTSGRNGNPGSVEIETTNGRIHIDVDLFKASIGGIFTGSTGDHAGEVKFNRDNKRGTHPGDVVKQLASRGVQTGVSCVN